MNFIYKIPHLPHSRLFVEFIHTPGNPGCTSGPPELRFEGEPDEIDFIRIKWSHNSQPSVDVTPLLVSSELCEELMQTLTDEARKAIDRMAKQEKEDAQRGDDY